MYLQWKGKRLLREMRVLYHMGRWPYIRLRDLLAVLQSAEVHRQLSTMYLDCMVLLKMTCVGSTQKEGKTLLIKLFPDQSSTYMGHKT